MDEIVSQSVISQVTVYPQAARLHRRVEVGLKAGLNRVLVERLPAGLVADTVKVEVAAGCRILEFTIEDRVVYRESAEAAGLTEAIRQDEATALTLSEGLKALDAEFLVFAERGSLAELLDPANPKLLQPTQWAEFLDFAEKRLLANRQRAREQYFALVEVLEKLRVARQTLQIVSSQTTSSDRVARLIIESPHDQTTAFDLVHVQPGASWHPAYNLRFLPATGRLSLTFFAMIRQQTGENWTGVGLALSTAMPLENCVLPILSSRRLREAKPELVVSRPSRHAAAADSLPQEKGVMMERAKRKKSAAPGAGGSKSEEARVIFDESDDYASAASGMAMPSQAWSPPPPAPPSFAPAPEPPRRGPVYPELGHWEIAASLLGDGRPDRFREWGNFQTLVAPVVPAEPWTGSANAAFQSGTDPQASSGGFDFRYQIRKARNDVASSTVYAQVPVETFDLPIRLVHVSLPSQVAQVYLKAIFQNGGSPLLRGPAQVFLENDYICSLDLATLGSQEAGTVSLGVDKDVKILRKEETRSRSKGLAFKDQVTDFEITIEVMSFKPGPVNLEVYDRIPRRSEAKAPEVFDLSLTPEPSHVASDGIVSWQLKLLPQTKQILTMKYSLKVGPDQQLVLQEGAYPHNGFESGGAF